MATEISLDNIDGDGADAAPVITSAPKEADTPAPPPAAPPAPEPETEESQENVGEKKPAEDRETVPVPDYSIPHDEFRALVAAQTVYANRVKIEQLALQYAEVRALLTERDELAAELAKLKEG